MPLSVQVLTPGSPLPMIAHVEDIVVPSPTQPVVSFTADLGDASWAVLRVTHPSQTADKRAKAPFASLGKALAYASPFFFERT